MNQITTIFLILVIVLIAPPTDAFIPGPNLILECSGCRQQLIYQTATTVNDSGMHTWTDRYCIAPFWPDYSPIIKCPSCGRTLWKDELNLTGKCEFYNTKEEYPDAIFPKYPSEDELIAAASVEDLNRDKEFEARIRSLWEANHEFRYKRESSVQYSDNQMQNMKRLMEIIDENEDDLRLLKAEIARELGDFDESLRLLPEVYFRELAEYRSLIEELSLSRIRKVQEIVDASDKSDKAK